MKIDPEQLREYRRQEAEHQAHIRSLITPRTRTDPAWRAEVAALVTPANTAQRVALHYATALGVIPMRINPSDTGKGTPPKGFTGHVALPEPATMADHVATIDDGQLLGIRLPDNIIGIDVDTYDAMTTGGIVHKTGGRTITRLEGTLGPLPPTIWSSRREPISPAPQHRTGILYFRINDRTLRYYRNRGVDYLRFRDIPGGAVETLAFGFRYGMTAPTTIDGLAYTWHAPDGTVLDPLTVTFDDLPTLPDTWCAHLLKDPRTASTYRNRSSLRTPGEPAGGGATYSERADAADQWCTDHIAGWTSDPDPYLRDLADRYIRRLTTTSRERHAAARDGTTAILNAAIGNERWPGHPGGQHALTRLAEAFLDAKPTTEALSDFNRGFAGAVDKIIDRLDTGDLKPIPATDIRIHTTTTEESAR